MSNRMITKFGEPLYNIQQLSEVSDIPIRTLKEWFEVGDLASFITTYEAPSGRRYYRWGAPRHWETPLHDHIYDLRTVVDK